MVARAHRAVRVSAVLGGALIAGSLLTGCGTANADDATPESRTFSLGGRELTVDTDNSAVELVPGDGDGKQVKVTRWFDGWALGGSTGVTWAMEDGGTLKLRVKCKGVTVGCEAKHRIEVPRGVDVTVRDGDGTITARGFESRLKVTSGNGAIEVRDTKGPLELKSSNGQITAEGVGSRKVSATTSNGEIRLGLTAAPDTVTTRTNNGSTRITVPRAPYKVTAGSGNGSVHVDVPRDDAAPHAVSAHSGNGSIDVRTSG
ncbi:DUF4097 family beta strand repeat-containing protein [Streptomyces sp. NPDC046261]|uniref:DUF4097 family beta strand repeat-containing protein n=1 Tax=Streptomyces sp. NPDC046261 TaxID=3157200 RepID=UPI0033C6BEFB